MSFLSINLGNSRASFAYFEAGRIATQMALAVDCEFQAPVQDFLKPLSIDRIGFCSVNPPIERRLRDSLGPLFSNKILMVGTDRPAGIPIQIRKPQSVGWDRLVVARAGWERVRGKCIVLDFGTAVTLNAVNQQGEFVGGAISAGAKLISWALNQGTAQLPQVYLPVQGSILGQDTREAISEGIHFGLVGLVREWVNQAKKELGQDLRVLATGGDCERMKAVGEIHEFHPNLVHEGIYSICAT